LNGKTAARIAWGVVAVIVGLIVAELVLLYIDRAAIDAVTASHVGNILVSATLAGLGALIASRQPQNRVGWIILCIGGAIAVNSVATLVAIAIQLAGTSSPTWAMWLAWSSTWTWLLFFPAGLTVLLFLLLPDGRLGGRRWRWLVWADLIYTPVLIGLFAVDPTPSRLAPHLPLLENPIGQTVMPAMQGNGSNSVFAGVVASSGLILLLLTVVAMLHRLYRSRDDERQQLKWIVYGSGTAILANVVGSLAGGTAQDLVGPLGFGVIIPASFGVAILKYGLYDIDVVIGRTLVYGSLAALITAVYVGIVVGIGSLIGSGGRPNLGLSIFATAVVAVGFQPVRDRLHKVANRLVYGRRATPYEVLSQFSERVAESYAGGDVLPRMAQVLQEGTGAEAATVWLRVTDRLNPAATHPETVAGQVPLAIVDGVLPEIANATRAVAVRHQEELLGALTVVKRRGEALTPIEDKLIDDLAHQAGLVLKNVGLTADLQARLDDLRASRQRLVAAQDEERRRLERNLHDGAQQNLVALKVKLGLAEAFVEKDPQRAKQLLGEVKSETDEALETLRDLARGIYPPLLAAKGLRAALQAQARKATLPVSIEGEDVGRYSQEVEAAVYFCVLEALQNVQKYAGATTAVVRLSELDHQLRFEVFDDGHGFDQARGSRGAGLTNMEDRLDALEGKIAIRSEAGRFTRVSGSLPLHNQVAGA
jgi:signal transduction histidine kinase